MTKTVKLRAVTSSRKTAHGIRSRLLSLYAQLNHWYCALKILQGVWRVENKWIVSQGNAVNLTPMDKLFDNGKQTRKQNNKIPTQAAETFQTA